jgi:hypothetical protein
VLLKCVAAAGADLGPYKRGAYYFPETRFDLTVGLHYETYAMMMINGGLAVLVADDDNDPFWYPIQAFIVADDSVPESWVFRFFPEVEPGGMPGEHRAQAIWGYPEMVHSNEHNEMLMNRQPQARAAFYAARAHQKRSFIAELTSKPDIELGYPDMKGLGYLYGLPAERSSATTPMASAEVLRAARTGKLEVRPKAGKTLKATCDHDDDYLVVLAEQSDAANRDRRR